MRWNTERQRHGTGRIGLACGRNDRLDTDVVDKLGGFGAGAFSWEDCRHSK